MFVMTAKVDIKKILVVCAVVAGIILALLLLFGGGVTETAGPVVSDNETRVQFLKDQGWDISTAPTESNQVRIPRETTPVYERYNALQKSQGYDLTPYAGKTVMRYVYKVNNYPGATEPVYATLLVYKNQIIGADITNTAPGGVIQGIKQTTPEPTQSATTPQA